MPSGDHRHCKSCGKVCDPGEETCSAECAAKRTRLAETRRNYTFMMYGLAALLLFVFVVGYLHL